MKKRVLSGLLVAAMALSITACGGKPAASSSTPAPSAAGSTAGSGSGASVDWPTKDITVVVPFNPGGDTDINARLYTEALSEKLGVNVICQNVNGNGGATGATQAYKAKNDGNTVLFYHTALVTNYVCDATDFGVDGFEIACIAGKNAGNVVCVNASSPYESLNDLIEASKTENITCAANAGATTYWMGALLNEAGANFNLVDMGGAAERVTALLGNQCTAIPNPVAPPSSTWNPAILRRWHCWSPSGTPLTAISPPP